MAYIDDLLARDERIVYVGRQHVFILVSNILAELFLIVILVAAGVVSQNAFQNTPLNGVSVGQLILLVCAVISVIIFISAFLDYFRWNNAEYVITDQRVIQLRGIFNKESNDSSLEKITDLELRQSWVGRIFDFGDIDILTASDVGVNSIRKLAHPLEFKRAMLEAKQHYNRGFGYYDPQEVAAYAQPPALPNRSGRTDIEQMLHSLAELRDQGLLSPEEFETKKRELLSRI